MANVSKSPYCTHSVTAPPVNSLSGCSFYDADVFDGWGAAFAIGSPYLRELP